MVRTRTANSYINEKPSRLDMVRDIEEKAQEYKNAVEAVQNICDNNINIPGTMNQILTAINDRTGMQFIPEVVNAKNCYERLQEAYSVMMNDGVPGIICMEFSRRILEEDILGGREFVYRGKET